MNWMWTFFPLFVDIKVQCLLFVTLMDIIIFDIDKIIWLDVNIQHSTAPQITWVVPFYFHIEIMHIQAGRVDFT